MSASPNDERRFYLFINVYKLRMMISNYSVCDSLEESVAHTHTHTHTHIVTH